ncbi:prepilin-type N-terminal cleavage/methylation domain-containing protein [Pelomonas sp. SE-A7]|uniref:pilin n=1 Tax=Pelomonas sp. SE-A7 TaxID=3054953 RepID=UPI00259CB5F2|nr:prepilin-type N-terminal cleavage/methylation domain-containing protein [Pelomonas sp. SE-A7]MDM4767055.1 prepilin-type N-terminal cleavage/methylation domain-containing protein [Pelomonas sp. SE-A7]
MKRVQQGFTLIELMIVVAIIGILAAVAIPQYKDYTSKSKAASAVSSLNSIKTAVTICAQEKGTLAGCNDSTAGIPAWNATPLISAVAVDATTGAVTATVPADAMGNSAAGSIILTPTLGDARVAWAITSTSMTTAVENALKKNNVASGT